MKSIKYWLLAATLVLWVSFSVDAHYNPPIPNLATNFEASGSIAATCSLGETFVDTDVTLEFCVCGATNVWGCWALDDGTFDATGPAD